jgi:DNA polymerase III epsilon subunit-like protein
MAKNMGKLLCLDWETSGASWNEPSHKNHQGISIGAIVADRDTLEPIDKLYIEIKFNPKYKWSPEAEKIHGLSREYLEKNGVTQEEAAVLFLEFISKYWEPDEVIKFIGHKPDFDIGFTDQLVNTVEFEFAQSAERKFKNYNLIKLNLMVIDTSALGFILLNENKSNDIFEAMGFEKRADHNALQDAEFTLGACAVMREIFKMGMAVVNEG